jgi:hypothetical protein
MARRKSDKPMAEKRTIHATVSRVEPKAVMGADPSLTQGMTGRPL